LDSKARRLKVWSLLAGYLRDRAGTIFVKFSLVLPVLLIALAGTVDHARYLREEKILQTAVDAASLAAAKEITVTNLGQEGLAEVVREVVIAWLRDRDRIVEMGTPEIDTIVRDEPYEVDVTAKRPFESAFGPVFGLASSVMRVNAIARVVGKPNICILGLNRRENGTISLEHEARVTGVDCAVFSNSAHNGGIQSKNDADLTASIICSAGGVQGGGRNFRPAPLFDCPVFDDPLADRPEPLDQPCDPNLPTVVRSDGDLFAGVYCSLTIGNGARVRLLPQGGETVFVFKGGRLVVGGDASLEGHGVGLHFTGHGTGFVFEEDSHIDLEAPRTGPLAGLLVFGSRSLPATTRFEILSNDARRLVGTIYIPKGELRVDATSPIADQSAYTAIVADKVRLYGGPHLVLNTNYSETKVPVPEGIKGTGQPIALAR
jgi:hypothetical protein